MNTAADLFAGTLADVAAVDGWLTPGQARMLWDAAARVPVGGRVVEIGSFRGRSTIVLSRAARRGVEIVAIEPHAGTDRGPQEISGYTDVAATDHEVFKANLVAAGVADRVRHVRRFSQDALAEVSGDCDLLYIDGAHRFGPARADIARWGGRVRTGGTLVIHDSFSSVGVTLASATTLFTGSSFRYDGRSRSLAAYRREHLSGLRRCANLGRQLAQLPWFARNLVIKALIVAHLGRVTRVLGHDPAEWPY